MVDCVIICYEFPNEIKIRQPLYPPFSDNLYLQLQ